MRWRDATPITSRTMLYQALGALGHVGGTICEIGVHKGQNAADMARHMRPVRFYLIDPWDGSCLRRNLDWDAIMAQARKRLYDVGAEDACVWLRMKSNMAARQIPDNSLDFAYIDGDHHCEAVWSDLQHYWCKVKVGGVLSGHEWGTYRLTNCVTPPVAHALGGDVRSVGSDSWYVRKVREDQIEWIPPERWHRKKYADFRVPQLTFGDLKGPGNV